MVDEMSPEERRKRAFDEFNELLGEGAAIEDAIKAAAERNDLKSEHFRAFAKKHLGDLENHQEKILLRAHQAEVNAVARDEIAKCRRREGPYKSLGAAFDGAERSVADQVEAVLGTALTKHDLWIIEDLWDEVRTAKKPERISMWRRLRDWQRFRT